MNEPSFNVQMQVGALFYKGTLSFRNHKGTDEWDWSFFDRDGEWEYTIAVHGPTVTGYDAAYKNAFGQHGVKLLTPTPASAP